jgi:hypothetical protein
MTTPILVPVSDIQAGDVIALDPAEPIWVTALKVKKDRYGFDLLFSPDDAEPRWRGFNDDDKVLLRERGNA